MSGAFEHRVLPRRGWPRRRGFWGRNVASCYMRLKGAVAMATALAPLKGIVCGPGPLRDARCCRADAPAQAAPKTQSGLGAQRRNLARPVGAGLPVGAITLQARTSLNGDGTLKGAGANVSLKLKGRDEIVFAQLLEAAGETLVSQEGGLCSTPLWKYSGRQ